MIRYRLACSQEHEFDTWFSNSADYDQQAAEGALSCPECGDKTIRKAIMAPSVGKTAATPAPAPACPAGGCGGGSCAFANGF